MSILFAGTPENAATTLEALVAAGVPISVVMTREDAPVGRKRIITPSPVAQVAERLLIPTIKTSRVDQQVISEFAKYEPEFAIVVAFGALLKDDALASIPGGWFNLHYSLLPKWRGAAPVQWSIFHGDRETGVSVFKIDKGLDTGSLVMQVPTVIEPGENASRLLARLTQLGTSALLEVIPKLLAGISQLHPQPETGITLAPKPTRQDAFIDFHSDANTTENHINGMNLEPGAWTFFNSEPFKLLTVSPSVVNTELGIGEVSSIDGSVVVGCQDGVIRLVEVQPAGKNRMSALDWYRGLKSETVRLGTNV